MVVVMRPGTTQESIAKLVADLEKQGVRVGVTNGVGCSILGLVGDTFHLDIDKISIHPDVERVMRVQEPYKKANRKFHPEDTVVTVGKASIGGGKFGVIAGPCSVESEEQIIEVAKDVQASGACMLRGGAFKPRTSPYSFQGMGESGLDLLLEADPSETMIDKYLDDGELYVLVKDGNPVCAAVVGQVDDETCELYNLATAEGERSKGYASKLVRHVLRLWQPRAKKMRVGTSKQLTGFYEKFGFRYAFTREGFFLNENYANCTFDEPDLKDMEVLEIRL